MLRLVHRVEQAVFTSQESSLDPVPSSISARNAQEIYITNCDVTTWSWAWARGRVNLVNPRVPSSRPDLGPRFPDPIGSRARARHETNMTVWSPS